MNRFFILAILLSSCPLGIGCSDEDILQQSYQDGPPSTASDAYQPNSENMLEFDGETAQATVETWMTKYDSPVCGGRSFAHLHSRIVVHHKKTIFISYPFFGDNPPSAPIKLPDISYTLNCSPNSRYRGYIIIEETTGNILASKSGSITLKQTTQNNKHYISISFQDIQIGLIGEDTIRHTVSGTVTDLLSINYVTP